MNSRFSVSKGRQGEYQLVDLTYWPDRRQLTGPARSQCLTPKAGAVFEMLLAQAPKTVSRMELLDVIWPGADISDAIVTDSVRVIRKALKSAGAEAGLVRTVPRKGYRIDLTCARPREVESGQADLLSAAMRPRPTVPSPVVWLLVCCLGLLAAVMSGLQPATAPVSQPVSTDEAGAYYLRGREFYERYRREDNEQAIAVFRRGLEAYPGNELLTAGLAEALAQAYEAFGGDATWAAVAYDLAISNAEQFDHSSIALRAAGLTSAVTGRHGRAAKYYQQAIQLDPANRQAMGNLGYLYVQFGQIDKALPLFEQGLAIDPSSARAHMFVGMAYRELGMFTQADRAFEAALRFELPTPSDHLEYLKHLMQQARWESAVAYADEVLAGSTSRFILEGKARALALAGKRGQANDLYAQLYEDPEIGDLQKAHLAARWLPLLDGGEKREQVLTFLRNSNREMESWAAANATTPALAHEMAVRFLATTNYEKAVAWLRTAVEFGWMNAHQTLSEPATRQALSQARGEVSVLLDEMRQEQRAQRDSILG